MEIAATMQKAHFNLDLLWVPREQNIEADELSNFDSKRFRPELEVKIDEKVLDFIPTRQVSG